MVLKHPSGKVVPILFVVLILIAASLGIGYYISTIRFDGKINNLNDEFEKFEGKYEMVLSSLDSEVREIKAYIEEKEGKTKEETNLLRMMSILLKAKGEIISAKLSLAGGDTKKSLDHTNAAINVLKEAFELANDKTKEKIEDLRLRLATAKGLIEVNSLKAQQELDNLWREIDSLTAK